MIGGVKHFLAMLKLDTPIVNQITYFRLLRQSMFKHLDILILSIENVDNFTLVRFCLVEVGLLPHLHTVVDFDVFSF